MTSGPYVIKRLTALINFVRFQTRVFVTVSHFHPSLTFAVKAGANQSGTLKAKIRLG
jgi:hypothetical protein